MPKPVLSSRKPARPNPGLDLRTSGDARLSYMADLISELNAMAVRGGHAKLAMLLAKAKEEAHRQLGGACSPPLNRHRP